MTATEIRTEQEIANLIESDLWRMDILRIVSELKLPDWAIGAGFIRAAVWDALIGKPEATTLPDIDVIYFDSGDVASEHDRFLLSTLTAAMPEISWDLKNQARMHVRNKDAPYRNTTDAVAHWLETPTCIAARLDNAGNVHILAPHGIEDLLALRVRSTPSGHAKPDQYHDRMKAKNWATLWPGLVVEDA